MARGYNKLVWAKSSVSHSRWCAASKSTETPTACALPARMFCRWPSFGGCSLTIADSRSRAAWAVSELLMAMFSPAHHQKTPADDSRLPRSVSPGAWWESVLELAIAWLCCWALVCSPEFHVSTRSPAPRRDALIALNTDWATCAGSGSPLDGVDAGPVVDGAGPPVVAVEPGSAAPPPPDPDASPPRPDDEDPLVDADAGCCPSWGKAPTDAGCRGASRVIEAGGAIAAASPTCANCAASSAAVTLPGSTSAGCRCAGSVASARANRAQNTVPAAISVRRCEARGLRGEAGVGATR